MRDYVIITDSTSDLGKDLRDLYNIDYVQMNITYDDKELVASLDWENYSPKELYDLLRGGKRIRTTQVPYITYLEKFTKYAKEGKDILYIACSSALSGSINIAKTVKETLVEEYKDTKFILIDSLISSLGQGHLAIVASKLRKEGKTIDEVANYIEENKLCVNQICTVESLEYLKRAGRIKATKAFFGNLLNLKPLIMSDAKGQNYAFRKVKGRKTSFEELIKYTKENIIDSQNQTIYISHADCESEVLKLKEELLKEVPCKDVYINYIGPIVGSSTGPGTVAIFFVGNKVTIVGE